MYWRCCFCLCTLFVFYLAISVYNFNKRNLLTVRRLIANTVLSIRTLFTTIERWRQLFYYHHRKKHKYICILNSLLFSSGGRQVSLVSWVGDRLLQTGVWKTVSNDDSTSSRPTGSCCGCGDCAPLWVVVADVVLVSLTSVTLHSTRPPRRPGPPRPFAVSCGGRLPFWSNNEHSTSSSSPWPSTITVHFTHRQCWNEPKRTGMGSDVEMFEI